MNTRITLAILMVIIFASFTNITPAKADGGTPESALQKKIKKVKKGKHPKQNNTPTIACNTSPAFGAPVMGTYLSQVDDGGDPLNFVTYAWAMYQDYLSDFSWWMNQTNACPSLFAPEAFPYDLSNIPPQ